MRDTLTQTVQEIGKKIAGLIPGCGMTETSGPKGLQAEIQKFIDENEMTQGCGFKVYEDDNGKFFTTSNYRLGY